MAYRWVTVMQVFAITGSRPSPREDDGKVVKIVYMYINYMNDFLKILLSQTITCGCTKIFTKLITTFPWLKEF